MRGRARAVGGAIAVVGILVGGCGKTPQAHGDGGDGPSILPDALAGGRHSFDVFAVLRKSGANNPPPTNSFTLVLDLDAQLLIAGGNGRGAAIGVTSADGRTFHPAAAGSFMVGGAGGFCSSGAEYVSYDNIELTVADGSLTGSASGIASISCGDCSFTVPFTATLTGAGDATLPSLRGFGAPPASPFDAFAFVTSEPLPADATARLVADDGVAIDLVPQIVDGDVPLVVGFSKPDVVLRAGHGYEVALDGLVDFAGHADLTGPPLRLTAFASAPSVLEDGFESVPQGALGGAMVMTAGPLPAIAGNTSLYIGGAGAPALDSTTGRTLMVRLSRQAGDTKLRFSHRVVAQQAQAPFRGALWVGSEGASPGSAVYNFADGSGPAEMVTVAGQAVFVSAVGSTEVTLPADATDDVLVVIAAGTSACEPNSRMSIGLLIDDLRLE